MSDPGLLPAHTLLCCRPRSFVLRSWKRCAALTDRGLARRSVVEGDVPIVGCMRYSGTAAGRVGRQRAAVRLSRAAAVFPLADVASSANVSPQTLRRHLKELDPRGRCAAMLAAACGSAMTANTASLHRVCPPQAKRVAAKSVKPSGTAGWAHGDTSGGPRRHIAALKHFVGDDDTRLNLLLASDPACDPQIWEELANHPRHFVRLGVARSPGCATAALELLSRSVHDDILCAVASHSRCPPSMFERSDDRPRVLMTLLERPDCPPSLVVQAANDRRWFIQLAAARSISCPAAMLGQLAEDHDWRVRRGVTQNPDCPSAVLAKLGSDTHPKVRAASEAASSAR